MGIANYSDSNGGIHNLTGDTATSFHTYTLNWQPEQLEWWVDGIVIRTVKKADTWKEQYQQYQYPTTPSRVQISIWPAGIPASPKGTVEWAGGMINWADQDYAANGYFWNTIKGINITCTDQLPIQPDSTGYQFIGNDSDNVPVSRACNEWGARASSTSRWEGQAEQERMKRRATEQAPFSRRYLRCASGGLACASVDRPNANGPGGRPHQPLD